MECGLERCLAHSLSTKFPSKIKPILPATLEHSCVIHCFDLSLLMKLRYMSLAEKVQNQEGSYSVNAIVGHPIHCSAWVLACGLLM